MKAALLLDRGVVKVAGDGARKFLNGLVTVDLAKAAPGHARFAALLTPQGKIIVDFIATEAESSDGGGFFLDCPRARADAGRAAQFLQAAGESDGRGFIGNPWRDGGLGRYAKASPLSATGKGRSQVDLLSGPAPS